MMPTQNGSLRLFRLFGITVFLHWTWFIVAIGRLQYRDLEYTSYFWYALEYVSLFLIVLMHEFGHSLACRSVGGMAEQIVLWPLGGVAYVSPPPRPGAMLWSIVAGPLVNVVLAPVLTGAMLLTRHWVAAGPDFAFYIQAIWFANLAMLVFNLLPIYPLDGGKILWSLLWFGFGRARALMIATVIGGLAVLALVPLLLRIGDVWLGIMAAFILFNCWRGWLEARTLARIEAAPRRTEFNCPACRAAPLRGDFWRCGHCQRSFDLFATFGQCPQCGMRFDAAACFDCGARRPLDQWGQSPPAPPRLG